MAYKPKRTFNTTFMVLNPTVSKVNNRIVKNYPEQSDLLINASYVTFGGSELIVNNVISVVDTGTIETWYRPDITADSRLYCVANRKTYEVMGDVENIEMRNQFLKFKVKSVAGSTTNG